MKERIVRFFEREMAIWGPLSLLCTLAFRPSLLFIAIVGLYLSGRWFFKGFVYALILLALSMVVNHAFFFSDHLWQLGLEGSLACAFFITALSFEDRSRFVEALKMQIETGEASLQNLEEEEVKNQEMATSQAIVLQEKIASLQKELEELQSDHSSILILNEVLRKTSARLTLENERFQEEKKQSDLLKKEIAELRQSLAWISNTEKVALQNKELMKELNDARFQREQAHLINETLARLYVRENLKAKEADQEAASYAEQLAAARREVQNIVEAPKPIQIDPKLEEQLALAQAKIVHLSQTEPLLKQLKKQFEEKNQLLAETRAELFKVDTTLQKLKIEKTALELSPIPKDVEKELENLSYQIVSLEEENGQLQELVTILTSSEIPKRKKKLKISSPNEQNLLF